MIGFNIPWILAHFIGDFLLQNEWMAINKKKDSFACSIHVLCYMIPWLFTSVTFDQFVLIAFQHWLQDRTTFVAWYCKTFGSFQNELKMNSLPWGHFIVDQIFHVIWILIVLNFVK